MTIFVPLPQEQKGRVGGGGSYGGRKTVRHQKAALALNAIFDLSSENIQVSPHLSFPEGIIMIQNQETVSMYLVKG